MKQQITKEKLAILLGQIRVNPRSLFRSNEDRDQEVIPYQEVDSVTGQTYGWVKTWLRDKWRKHRRNIAIGAGAVVLVPAAIYAVVVAVGMFFGWLFEGIRAGFANLGDAIVDNNIDKVILVGLLLWLAWYIIGWMHRNHVNRVRRFEYRDHEKNQAHTSRTKPEGPVIIQQNIYLDRQGQIIKQDGRSK